ncbi:MAG TPA: hypothetical protein VFL31_06555 [Nitrospiraceae bacterium]|nr:hypothetical protein [Nitrospiraceae bacterium]
MNPEWVHEVQQLWAVALNYLKYADGLKKEGRTYEDFVTTPDPVVLARSADLDSAAIRLASLDELLNGGMNAVRDRAYPRDPNSPKAIWPVEYMHIFLRDAVAHAEPLEGVDKASRTKRQEWLRKQRLGDSLAGVVKARNRLQKEIEELCRSAAKLDKWMRSDVTRWLSTMKTRGRTTQSRSSVA